MAKRKTAGAGNYIPGTRLRSRDATSFVSQNALRARLLQSRDYKPRSDSCNGNGGRGGLPVCASREGLKQVLNPHATHRPIARFFGGYRYKVVKVPAVGLLTRVGAQI